MPRIVIRAHKNPFDVADAETTYGRNLIGNNTGNLVFSQSVYRLLARSDTELTTSTLLSESAERLNEEVDHLVIPLANAFRPDYVHRLESMSTLIEQLTIPVTVLGVGAQASLTGQQKSGDVVGTATTRFVRAVLDRSSSIGVRGDFTRDYLRGLGFSDEHVQVIGCPSIFMWGPDLAVERRVERLTQESPIAFNVSPYVTEMGPLSQYCAERYPNLVYMAQNIQSLELMLYGTYPMGSTAMVDNGAPVTLDHPLVRENRIRFFLDPTTWFEELRRYDFSFGTRIHGNIASLLAGTPAVLLAHDARTLELAEYHEIPHRLITEVASDTDPVELHAEASWDRLVKGHGGRWDTFAGFLAAHDLPHVYSDGQDPTAFDRAMADLELPPPVEPLTAAPPEALYAIRRDLRDTRAELVRTEKRLQRATAKLEEAKAREATAKAATDKAARAARDKADRATTAKAAQVQAARDEAARREAARPELVRTLARVTRRPRRVGRRVLKKGIRVARGLRSR